MLKDGMRNECIHKKLEKWERTERDDLGICNKDLQVHLLEKVIDLKNACK